MENKLYRLYRAFINSFNGIRYLVFHEKAVQQECIVFLISLPVAYFIANSVMQYFILIFSILFVLIVEVLNTAIESVCDTITRDYREEIKIAKDAGSLAVLLSMIIALCIWVYAIATFFMWRF